MEVDILTRSTVAICSTLVLSACASTEIFYVPPSEDLFAVQADFETPVVASIGDSADDPAIYVGTNGNGFIAGTDKQAGIYIYNLDGTERKFWPVGTVNNVDLRGGFIWNGREYVLLLAGDDDNNTLVPLFYHPESDQFARPDGGDIAITPSPYGLCLGRVGHDIHAGITTKAGVYYQYRIFEGAGDGQGKVEAELLRQFRVGTQIEGCVIDDRTGKLYIAEENGGLFVYGARPADGDARDEIARVGQNGLMTDLEGVTVYPQGDNGGYLLVSSQGNNTYGVFELPSHDFAGQFEIAEGGVDQTSKTDGIDVTPMATPQFPDGFLVVQDNQQDQATPEGREKQNFKIVDWRKIKAGLN
ncbi:MAG: phytase [Hyphomonadaceae bacterium]|nr:phytase [Hyphomonadaceae bacterium]